LLIAAGDLNCAMLCASLALTGVPFKGQSGVNAKDIEGGNVMKVIVAGAGIGGLTAHRVCKKSRL
jgi:hypothetical protein